MSGGCRSGCAKNIRSFGHVTTGDFAMTTSYRSAQIKELRTSRAWSQEQFAKMSGLDVRTIQRIEKGEPASFESLKSVASVLKMNVSDLLNEKKTEEKKKTGAETPKGDFIIRVSDGNQLFTLMNGAHAYAFNNDTLESDDDTQLVADFLQELHDWGELGDDIGPGERVRTAHEYTKKLKTLRIEGSGFLLAEPSASILLATNQSP